jgi:hypothetical protein
MIAFDSAETRLVVNTNGNICLKRGAYLLELKSNFFDYEIFHLLNKACNHVTSYIGMFYLAK